MSELDARLRRLARRRGWVVQIRSRGVPPRSAWRPPAVAETELLRDLLPGVALVDVVRTVTIHRARVQLERGRALTLGDFARVM